MIIYQNFKRGLESMRDNSDMIAILKDFHMISGFRISIHDLDFKEICAYPSKTSPFCDRIHQTELAKKCMESDKIAFSKIQDSDTPYVYKCHCGLVEAMSPLYHYGILSGYLMMGQVRDNSPFSLLPIRETLSRITKDGEDIERILSKIKIIDSERISSYVNIMKLVAEHITATNKANYRNESLAELIKKYINKNYDSKISLNLLSEKFGCSNSTIMKQFKEAYNTTVSEYINEVRLTKAVEMVKESTKSVKEIAAACGFSDQNYFSRQFSEKFGIPPTEYRKNK